MEAKLNSNGCYIGCRISTQKQAQEGESLDDQEKICIRHAKSLGLPIIEVFREQHSATKEGDSFIDDIIKNISKQPVSKRGSHFIIKSIDRFCRAGTSEYSKLKDSFEELGIQLIDAYGIIQPKINILAHLGVKYKWSTYSPSEGSEIMEAHKSKREVSDILGRMISAEIKLVREGYKVRSANDGFTNKKVFIEGKKRVIQVPDPNRSSFYIKMFKMSATHTDQEVVDYVNNMGYRSKERHIWSKSKDKIIGYRGDIPLTIKKLQSIRQRPIYCGVNTELWLEKPIRTEYEGLVSIDDFNRANRGKIFIEEKKDGSIEIHKDYNVHQLKRMKDNPLFPHKAVVLCPICRKPFLGSASTNKLKNGYPSYHCTRKHKRYAVNKKDFEKELTHFVSNLKYKDKGFIKSFEAVLVNKFREKEKELGEFSIQSGSTVIELEREKKQKIEAFTSTKNETIRAELEKQIDDIHNQIEKMREQRNNLEIEENDVHSFIGYVKNLMEHPVEMLVKQEDITALKGLFSLVFDELPTYEEIVNGTPKLSLPYKLSEEFHTNKSLNVTLRGVEPRFKP